MSESDGIEDALEGQLRMGLLVAGRVAEELARQRERSARAAEQQSLQAARDLADRVAADRTAARAQLVPLERDAWWDRAQPSDIEAAWQTARQWQDVEPDAARAAETIRENVRDRYGIDVDALERDSDRGDALSTALDERAEQERQRAAQATREGDQERTEAAKESVVASLLASEAAEELNDDGTPAAGDDSTVGGHDGVPHQQQAQDAVDRAATSDQDSAAAAADATTAARGRSETSPNTATAHGPAYDSPERRKAAQSQLQRQVGAGQGDAVEARMTADKANARPVSDAAQGNGAAGAQPGRRRTPFGRSRGQAHGVER